MASYVVRNGLNDGHGFPSRAAAMGMPTQMPIQNSTAGRYVMPPITNPLTMAPYHHTSPSSRSTRPPIRATESATVRVG